MPALLLSSASGTNASVANITAVSKPADALKSTNETSNILGSFGEKLSASIASLGQAKQSLDAESSIDLDDLSATLNGLGVQLEALDPALFESLRSFLNGHDLSPKGLKALEAGGELPNFFAELQAMLHQETNLESLNDIELSSLESIFSGLSLFINNLASDQAKGHEQSDNAVSGFTFSISKDNNAGNLNGDSILNNMVAESDQSFKAHVESLKTDIPAELSELADALLEPGQEGKDKSSLGKFADLQLRTVSDTLKPYSTTLNTPVDSKEWAEEVSQKIVWFTGRNIQAAEMHLNPADLGPIDVKINVQNDVASVTFNVQNASVRELLESNVVRLREMMESNGVNLGDVNVDSGKQDSYQQTRDGRQQQLMSANAELSAFSDEDGQIHPVTVKSSNLVDYFV